MIKKTALLLATFISLHSPAQETTKDTCKTKNREYKTYYYSNGQKKEEGYLVNEKKEGIWKTYSENGNWKTFEWNYKSDEKNGLYKAFSKSGKVNAIGKYINGSISDTLTIFDEENKIVSKSVWKSTGYRKSQKIWQEIYAKDAKPDGTTEYIDGKKYYWQLGQKLLLKN